MFADPRPVRAIMLALALVAFAPAALAQQPSPAAMSIARDLITAKGAMGMYDALIPGVVERAKTLFLRSNPSLSKELNEVAAKLRADYASRNAEVRDMVVRLYASHFTEKELKDALAFYKTSLGKKLIEQEPKILEQSMTEAQSWGDKLSEEVIVRIRAEMKKKGHDI